MTQVSRTDGTNDESTTAQPTAEIGLTLFLRAAPTGPALRRQAAVRSRFEGLDVDADTVETTVERWPKTVTTPVDGTDATASAALDRYETFEAAVRAAGGRLEPFFQRRGRTGGLLVNASDGEVYTFPVCCLAVWRGDTLTGLYPCWVDEYHYSVEEGLAGVEDGDSNNLV